MTIQAPKYRVIRDGNDKFLIQIEFNTGYWYGLSKWYGTLEEAVDAAKFMQNSLKQEVVWESE